jgi:hypothetical protein
MWRNSITTKLMYNNGYMSYNFNRNFMQMWSQFKYISIHVPQIVTMVLKFIHKFQDNIFNHFYFIYILLYYYWIYLSHAIRSLCKKQKTKMVIKLTQYSNNACQTQIMIFLVFKLLSVLITIFMLAGFTSLFNLYPYMV